MRAIWQFTLLVLLGFVASFAMQAEAQTRAGRGVTVEKSRAAENACRLRVEDLRTNIGELRSQLSQIRACSEQRKMAIRQAGNIVCRDISLPHHRWTNLTEIAFGNPGIPGGYGETRNIRGTQGDDGRDVQCAPCTANWQNPVCPPNHNGSYTAMQTCSSGDDAECTACWGAAQQVTQNCTCNLPGTWVGPSCPAGFTGTHTGLQTCSAFGQCCGAAPTASVECCNGSVCAPCDDWTAVNTWCPALNRNVVSSYTCPSGNCCAPEPTPETCPGACTPGFYTYEYTNWTACTAGNQTRECNRCDGQSADCGECGGECSRTCTEACTTFSWHASNNWGACSGGGTQTCGAGQQTRPGVCKCDQTGETVSATLCALEDRQRACTYSYAFDTNWGACTNGTRIKACKRCDGQNAACSDCGGACPSESCGNPNVTYSWSRVGKVYGPGRGCHLSADMDRAYQDAQRGDLVAHGSSCPYAPNCDFTVNESRHPCNAQSAGQHIFVYSSCGDWQSGLEGYSGYTCEASDGSHCPDNGGYSDDTWDNDRC